ncbi:MAG: glycoside hydrolase family 5 protein [Treponema sp.]|nr:glycoside hydrolase family 5 protein [Treponema sp.]
MIKILYNFRKFQTLLLTVLCMLFISACSNEPKIPDSEVALYFDETSAVKDNGNKQFNGVSATQTVKDMTVGWNLGNTLDATGGSGLSSETSWSQPKTTKAMIDGLANSGIKTIRIPVSWSNHMNKKNYTIDSAWMNRVKTIVDWAIEDGMYVILNDHHDNFGSPAKMTTAAGYYPNKVNKNESERFLLNLWTQIALAFNNGYDEHLIFETLNEPRLAGTNNEWWFDSNNATCREAADCLNEYNQLILDTIRKSGGNNQKRYVSCPGLQASPDSAFASAFKMPQDDEKGKLILSVHMYTPYSFAMESPGETIFTSSHQSNLDYYFSKLNNSFISKGYPVIIGEMGATNKNNLDERVKWFNYFLTESRKYGMTSCLWDNGVWEIQGNKYDEHYGFYNRQNQTWYFPEILEAMINSTRTDKM